VLQEAADVLAADQRNVLAELLLVQLDQPAAMLALFRPHFGEQVGAGGIIVAQALGDIGVNTAVLFLVGDRQGKDFAFGQLREVPHRGNLARAGEGQAKNRSMRMLRKCHPISAVYATASAASTAAPNLSTIVSISAAVEI